MHQTGYFTPDQLQMSGYFESERVLQLVDGQHRVVAEESQKKRRDLVAREVFVHAGAIVECSGLMQVLMYGGSVRAHRRVMIDAYGGHIEAITAEVWACGPCTVIARQGSLVYAENDGVVVHAFDESIVIVQPKYRPTIKVCGQAQVIRHSEKQRPRRKAQIIQPCAGHLAAA